MTEKLPYSRVVDVTVTRQDKFPTTAGFSTALLVQPVALTGKVDATTRTKLYATIEEVAADWVSTTEAYKAAASFFKAKVRPKALKIAYRNTANPIADEMNAIWAADSDWYWGLHTKELADTAALADQKALADWAETHNVIFGLDSNDTDTETAGGASTTSIAAYVQANGYDRSAVFWHETAGTYLAAAAWGYASGRDLDKANYKLAKKGVIDSGQAYTMKFKTLPGIVPISKGSAAVQAITGFVPGTGLSADAGYFANTYVDIGGVSMLVEGSVGSGAFIDEIHATDWIRARMQESVLGVLANNARVPFTNPGAAFLVEAGVQPPMRRAVAAGIIAGDLDDDGIYQPAYEIAFDDVENLTASQRRQRIAPDIKVTFRYAGAFHYASVTMTLTF